MFSRQVWTRAFRVAVWTLPTVFLPTALLVAGATWLTLRTGRPAFLLFRDPAAIAHISPLAGVFSSIGVLMWTATAAVALLVAVVSWKLDPSGASWRFFAAAGTLTAALLLDDFFMVHEYAEEYLHIPQPAFYFGYLAALIAYLVAFRRQIADSDVALLLIAAGFLGLSAATDVISERLDPGDTIRWRIAVEDGSKFLGILGWCAYHVRTATLHVLQSRREGTRSAAGETRGLATVVDR